MSLKSCKHCRAPFTVAWQGHRALYCSQPCRTADYGGTKSCLICGATFEPFDRGPRYRESRKNYAQRKCCSNTCSKVHRGQLGAAAHLRAHPDPSYALIRVSDSDGDLMPLEDIAAALGLNRHTVAKTLESALEKVRAALGG